MTAVGFESQSDSGRNVDNTEITTEDTEAIHEAATLKRSCVACELALCPFMSSLMLIVHLSILLK